jgi:hypothetical protein
MASMNALLLAEQGSLRIRRPRSLKLEADAELRCEGSCARCELIDLAIN